jgi:hypothetical protein
MTTSNAGHNPQVGWQIVDSRLPLDEDEDFKCIPIYDRRQLEEVLLAMCQEHPGSISLEGPGMQTLIAGLARDYGYVKCFSVGSPQSGKVVIPERPEAPRSMEFFDQGG